VEVVDRLLSLVGVDVLLRRANALFVLDHFLVDLLKNGFLMMNLLGDSVNLGNNVMVLLLEDVELLDKLLHCLGVSMVV